jgi:hypothetical protein
VGLYGPSPPRRTIGESIGTPSHDPPGMGKLGGLPQAVGSQLFSSSSPFTSWPPSNVWNILSLAGVAQKFA